MDRQKRIDAMLSSRVVLSRIELAQFLLESISNNVSNLELALESDKFHLVGYYSSLVKEAAEDLRLVLDSSES